MPPTLKLIAAVVVFFTVAGLVTRVVTRWLRARLGGDVIEMKGKGRK